MRKKTHTLGRISSAAIRQRLKRQNETPEEKEERRNKAKIYAAVKRANETPEERQKRLATMKMNYKQHKQVAETTEQRTTRLSQLAARKASAISKETPEQKELRLMRNRILLAARRASETPEKREKRLSRARIQKALERTFETPEQREKRLSCVRNQKAFKRASETPEEKRDRRSRMKYLTALRRVSKKDENVDNRRQTTAQFIRDLCQNIDKKCVPNTDTLLQCINEFCSNDSVKVLGLSDKICQNCGTLKLKYISTDKSSTVMETCTACQRRNRPSTSKTKLTNNIKTENFQIFNPPNDDDALNTKDPLALPLLDMPIDALTAKDYTVPFIDVIKVESPGEVLVKTELKCEEEDTSDINICSDNDNVLLGI